MNQFKSPFYLILILAAATGAFLLYVVYMIFLSGTGSM